MERNQIDNMKLYFLLNAMAKCAGVDPEKFGYENAKLMGSVQEHEEFMKQMTEGHIKYLEETNSPDAKKERDIFEKLKEKYK